MSDTPGARLAVFRKSLGLKQREFASAVGFSPSRIGSIESGAADLSRAFLERLSARYNVSADWLLEGRGEMLHAPEPGFVGSSGRRIEPPDRSRPGPGDFSADGEEYALIERMDLSVSAGIGLEPVEGGQRERLAFSRTWLRRQGINEGLAFLVRVKGDSMAPGIPDGALALVHVAEGRPTGIVREGIYAFNRHGASFIKRVAPIDLGPDGRPRALLVVSDNPAYAPELLEGEDAAQIDPVGRVRCVMTSL